MGRFISFIIVVAILGGAGYGAWHWWSSSHDKDAAAAEGAEAGGPPPEVSVVTVSPEVLSIAKELPGRTSAYKIAEIRPQVNGIITKRFFEEGSLIKQGQQLYQIDAAPYNAALTSAKAELMQAQANIQALQAKQNRYGELVKIGGISQQEFDDSKAALAQGEAAVAVANANVTTAQINVNYTRVLSPISGRIGKSFVTEGALVTANQAQILASVQQLDPIYVDVTQSSAELMALRQQFAGTAEGEKSSVTLLMEGSSSPYNQHGTLEFSDVTVDETTGMVTLRALFPNPDHTLLPGLFVRAQVEQGRQDDAITVPQQSVLRNPDGSTIVMVVEQDGKVGVRPVVVSKALNDKWQVTSGLKGGEQVIVEGIMKVKPGAPAKAVPYDPSGGAKGAAPTDENAPAQPAAETEAKIQDDNAAAPAAEPAMTSDEQDAKDKKEAPAASATPATQGAAAPEKNEQAKQD